MLEVLKACMQPEPAKRLTALEVLALPYFDDILEILEGMDLQDEYDRAYALAAESQSQTAHSLWTSCRACTVRRLDRDSSPFLSGSAMVEGSECSDVDIVSPRQHSSRLFGRSSSMAMLMQSAPETVQKTLQGCGEAPTGPVGTNSEASGIASHTLRRSTTLGDKQSSEMQAAFSSGAKSGPPHQPMPPPMAGKGLGGSRQPRVHFSVESALSTPPAIHPAITRLSETNSDLVR